MNDIRTLKRMYQQLMYILNSKQKRKLVVLFFAIFIGALLETLGVSSLMPLVQILTDTEALLQQEYILAVINIFSIESVKTLTIMIGIAVMVVFLVKNIGLTISSYLLVRYKADLTKELKYEMMRCYMNRPYQFFVDSDTGKILRGVTGDVESVVSIVDYAFHILTEGAVILLIGIFVVLSDPIMAIGIIFVGALCFTVIVLILKRKMSTLGQLGRAAESKAFSVATQIVNGIKDIMVRQKRHIFLEKFNEANEDNREAQIGSQFASVLPERIIETICICGIMAVVLIRIALGQPNEQFITTLAVFVVAAFRILPAISRLTGYVNLLIYGRPRLEASYDNVKSSREYMESIGNKSDGTEIKRADRFGYEDLIKIKDVFWKYNDAQGDVLKGVSIEIHKGESIGIIGESGSGKSTLSDILLGLYRPQRGEILVDGKSIFDYSVEWSEIMGYVPQSVYLLDDTIRNNVAFGETNIADEQIWEALEKASLKTFVESLPNGLDTMVGERGVKFSGGQRQRVAIARALLMKPEILILDEATSALDNETETAVMDAVESLQGTITMIIIAHRLTTIKNCDRVFEIKGGVAKEVYGK